MFESRCNLELVTVSLLDPQTANGFPNYLLAIWHYDESSGLQKPQIDSGSDNGLKPDHLLGNIELKNVDFVYESRPEIKVTGLID